MKIIFAGGGTGGHLFPGIALAQALSSKSSILFLCTNRPFDKAQLDRYKFAYQALSSPRLPSIKRPWTVISFIINVWAALYRTNRCFSGFKPDIVVGLGGYGAFSSLIIALLRGVPFVLLEQNVLPGRISRLFSPFARQVFCQREKSLRHLRNRKSLMATGSPIRQEILSHVNRGKADARKQLGLTREHIMLVIGGSQGAEALNRAVVDNMEHLKRLSDRLGIVHLTGQRDYQRIKEAYGKSGIEHLVKPFSDDMGLIYAASDLAFSRSGGIAISEMTLFGLSMFLVPYPQAADNHQFFNAMDVYQKGAGILVSQNELTRKMAYILSDIERNGFRTLGGISLKAKMMARPGAAEEIIDSLPAQR
ncbi:MAG: UDP-N-acetylglucosamine--N-acetylmuramyl-(pentapeptide) pyrophosphoryl-undecaprenol N-acetylglucosamine transferase [Planctomycetes bacterium]|nr:UDP-N-acetylglucosamine--N-acetylmuramyl-(pentapeptide) pyrophosphoryl-undecaprenol N-acetylglucosamine transferase [Planctomycetota bacterium]